MIVTMNGQPIEAPRHGVGDAIKGFYHLFVDAQENGTWHALTGEFFLPWMDARIDFAALVVGMGAALFGMFGSKLAWRVLWWDIAAYIILKCMLGVLI